MKNILKASSLSRGTKKKQLQQGLVLEIALIVIIVMLIATIGLYRSVDASMGITGNLAFKRDAENRTRIAVHEVLTWVENNVNYQDFIINGVDDPTNNFSARMLQTDVKGIPAVLAGDTSAFDAVYTKVPTSQMKDDSSGTRVRYVIERMCTRLGTVSNEYCSTTASAGKTMGTQPGKGSSGLYRPLLRVSIRVDGPRNTVAYAQAMIDP
jgi:Tfp pilus assembly protein PilX